MQNQIINMCRVLIGPNAVVTDDQINDAIERVSLIFPNMDIAQVKSELLSLYGVRIQDFQILEGNERRQPWLRDFKAERKSTWDFWVRYKQYLSEQKGFAPLVIQKLDEMSDRILDNLFNPQLTNITIDKKGLVVGQVQSAFWGRGNGWVLGGLVEILKELPKKDKNRKFYEELFVKLATRVAGLQHPDGFWHASLLDPASYPSPETSCTTFIVYSIAYGINEGLLDKEIYLPVMIKGWNALVSAVEPNGKLGYVQQIGADPKKVTRDMTEVYGVGAFLMAGNEIYKMAR